jgi:argininosuccinate lyase
VSQDPLAGIRRKQPRKRGVFPDETYEREWLRPVARRAEDALGSALLDVYRAHAVMLAEQRIVEADPASGILRSLLSTPGATTARPDHALSVVEAAARLPSDGELFRGLSREEATVGAMRMVLRDQVLDLLGATLDLREIIASVASGHLTTLMLPTSNGQVVQPTTLGHYLTAHLGPLVRACARMQECWRRLNQSPLGAGSGMSTALPIRRGRVAELLGFDAVVESTFDALASNDLFTELVSVTASLGIESSRLVSDMQYWARDDVGLLIPGDEYLHAGTSQPQRRDPMVLDYLRAHLAELAAVAGRLGMLLFGQAMLGGEATRQRAFELTSESLVGAARAHRLLASVLRTAVVNRAMFAHRTNRGFTTSSELADLLMVDHHVPRELAYAVVERVVIEATEAGGEAARLKPEDVDAVALRMIGRELGIEPEVLARCLAPKRFVERRTSTGGPAPKAVTGLLDHETFSSRRDAGWRDERLEALRMSRAALLARASEIANDPTTVRRQS